jgi:hypothetical protein
MKVDPCPTTGVLRRKENRARYMEREQPCDNFGSHWSDAPISQEIPRMASHQQKPGTRQGKVLP